MSISPGSSVYEIDGFSFVQLLSFRGYEDAWLRGRQKARMQASLDALSLMKEMEKISGESIQEMSFEQMLMREDIGGNVHRLKELTEASRTDSARDTLDLIVRSRLKSSWLPSQGLVFIDKKELSGWGEAQADPENRKDKTRLLDDERIALIGDRIISEMTLATQAKVIEFFNMEAEGVSTPEELPEEWQEVEAENPKAQKNDSPKQSKQSTKPKSTAKKGTTKSKQQASKTPASTDKTSKTEPDAK